MHMGFQRAVGIGLIHRMGEYPLPRLRALAWSSITSSRMRALRSRIRARLRDDVSTCAQSLRVLHDLLPALPTGLQHQEVGQKRDPFLASHAIQCLHNHLHQHRQALELVSGAGRPKRRARATSSGALLTASWKTLMLSPTSPRSRCIPASCRMEMLSRASSL